MQIRRELAVWMGVFLALYVVMAFGAIQLLVRMTPAIERILRENVYSVTAVEEMLAAAADPVHLARSQKFLSALQKARNNITELAETEILDRIDPLWRIAMDGDAAAMSELVPLLEQLGRINRESMQRADAQAKRLGRAGAWAVAMLGFSGFLIGLYAMRRLRRHFLDPLEEIHDVMRAFQQKDRFRRCALQRQSPEFREIGEAINRLLDMEWSQSEAAFRRSAHLDRAALLRLMDNQSNPLAVLDAAGQIHATNAPMDQVLNGPGGEQTRALFARIASGETSIEGIQTMALNTGGWLCALL